MTFTESGPGMRGLVLAARSAAAIGAAVSGSGRGMSAGSGGGRGGAMTMCATKGTTTWVSTALRVRNLEESESFFSSKFGLEKVREETASGGEETSVWLGSPLCTPCIEIVQERQGGGPYDSGNNEPKRGFGHLAFMMGDVYKESESLEKSGVAFRKRPDEGRMKGLAFCLSPDGYWIELVGRAEGVPDPPSGSFSYAQTMIRIKDPKKSLPFYVDALGGTLINERHYSDFSLYFVAWLPEGESGPSDPTSPEARDWMKSSLHPVIELTHNHGTESDPNFSYHSGNTEPLGFKCLRFRKPKGDADFEKLKQSFTACESVVPVKGQSDTWTDPDGYHISFVA